MSALEIENDSAEKLVAELPTATQTLPLWAQMTRLNPPQPNPKAIPHIWRYDTVKPYLLRAGRLVTDKQAERRVLMLVNPAMGSLPPPSPRYKHDFAGGT